jgi:hypothetical protein
MYEEFDIKGKGKNIFLLHKCGFWQMEVWVNWILSMATLL